MKRGLLIVFTGKGKGKTTAALGMALRAVGHGMRVLVLQFIKGDWRYGELSSTRDIPGFQLVPLGSGFTWEKDNPAEDRLLAHVGWERATREIESGQWDMIVLDELNIVLSYGLLETAEVVSKLSQRPSELHVVVTGRNAPNELMEAADLVTEMKEVKHPFRTAGIKAQKGVEF